MAKQVRTPRVTKTNNDLLDQFIERQKENPLNLKEATKLLEAIDKDLSVKVKNILIKDKEVSLCHWRCKSKNHGPFPFANVEDFKTRVLNPIVKYPNEKRK
jgi:hypothetical protein